MNETSFRPFETDLEGDSANRNASSVTGMPWRPVLFAALLLAAGLILFSVAISMINQGHKKQEWIPGIVLGVLTMLPGGYVLLLAVGARLRWRGFSYENIPQGQLMY